MMLNEEAVKTKPCYNLCTYFILPLCGLDKLRFGGLPNFLNCYLSRNGIHVYVKVIDPDLVDSNLPEYCIENKRFLRFTIPSEFKEDVHRFINGEYSKFSERTKRIIRTSSTLSYKKYRGTIKVTDYRLLALQGSASLRSFWESLIYDDVDVVYRNEIGDELLSKPEQDTFYPVS